MDSSDLTDLTNVTANGKISSNDPGNLPGALFIKELGSVFVDALTEVISKVSGFMFEDIGSETNGADELNGDVHFDGMIGIMSLNAGKKNIMIFLSAKENDMRVICSYMSGLAQNEILKDDMYDTLGELVNMTAGNVKLRIGEVNYTFALSLPFAINGENMSIITKKRVNIFSKVLGNGEISVKLKIVY